MPLGEPVWPDLGFPDHGSISVGPAAGGGILVAGRPLEPDGEHHRIMDEHRLRWTNWGTDELIEAIVDAAAHVADRFPGSILSVGNISRQGGGSIPWSISHNAGRDVDLGFYVVGEEGESLLLPAMIPLLPPDGTAELEGITVRFDPARNWALLESFLESERVTVQYAFCASFLVDLMFAHARSQGVSGSRLAKLREIVRQPRGTLPHDDHVHIRVLCTADDLADGCRNIVGGREVVPRDHGGFRARCAALAEMARTDGSPERRAAALARLAWMKAPQAQKTAYAALDQDDDWGVKVAALRALEKVGASPRVGSLLRAVETTENAEAAAIAFRLLRRASSRESRKVAGLLEDPRVLRSPVHFFERVIIVRAEACRLLGWLGDLSQGTRIVPLLRDDDPAVREAALWALRCLAADEVFPDSVVEVPPDDVADQWKRFVRRHKDVGRNLQRTLAANGYKVPRNPGRRDVRELLRAIRDADHISINVQRLLNRLTNARIPLLLKDKGPARWLWKKAAARWKRKR
jgi:hypothetical protein